ncbi:MAG: OsmC family protein [Pseudomonadota bacterium]
MDIQLRRLPNEPVAQTIRIGAHELVADASLAEGGSDAGPSPHDLYDAALGACKALTVLLYAQRKGFPVEEVQTRIVRDDSQERAGTYRLKARLEIRGSLTDEQLQELARVAGKCPVHKLMTTVVTEIETEVQRVA